MPSKLRRAIDAVKDNASISLALVSGSSDVSIAVLRATSHDPSPSDEHAVAELLFLTAASPDAAVRAISRRLSRTANWVVAVKSLSLISRAISESGQDFRREALAAPAETRRRLLDLSDFCDGSGLSSPWDFTAFVRTLALYLDARLEASAAGKLPRRPLRAPVSGQKPPVLVDRMVHWQRLLDRAMGTKPTGQAREHRLVRFVFQSVVRESFDLYRDIADGMSFLLDGFFDLPANLCQLTFKVSKAASKQFVELEEFYMACKTMGIGRKSEYPSIRKISASLLETLEDFLKDKNSTKQIMMKVEREEGLEFENWELALAESMKELSIKTDKKPAFSSGFRNPFLRASNDRSLMAVTSSPLLRTSVIAENDRSLVAVTSSPLMRKSVIAENDRNLMAVTSSPLTRKSVVAENDKSLMAVTSSSLSLLSGESNQKMRGEVREEEEEDPFEELVKRERPPLSSNAARDFHEQYHMKGR